MDGPTWPALLRIIKTSGPGYNNWLFASHVSHRKSRPPWRHGGRPEKKPKKAKKERSRGIESFVNNGIVILPASTKKARVVSVHTKHNGDT
jgi:hypothetical protein